VARALDTVEEHLGEQAPTHPAGKSSASTGPAAGRPGELAMSQRDAARRIRTFDEVTGGLDLTSLFEAHRCTSCGNYFGCDNCYGVCPDNAVIKLGTGKYQYDYCKGCGLCAAECPCGAVEMEPESSRRFASRRGITGLGASPGAPVEWKASRAAPGVSK